MHSLGRLSRDLYEDRHWKVASFFLVPYWSGDRMRGIRNLIYSARQWQDQSCFGRVFVIQATREFRLTPVQVGMLNFALEFQAQTIMNLIDL